MKVCNLKSHWLSVPVSVFILLILSAGLTFAQGPLTTYFTYQGHLTDGGAAANGAYDFEFKLYDTPAAGTQIGATNSKNDVTVTNGLFAASLTFGPGAFNGSQRFLQVGVRPGPSTGSYTPLSPRQELMATPNAQFASTAQFASAPWATNGSNISYNGGNVGVGTSAPADKLTVQTATANYGIIHTDGTIAVGTWIGTGGGSPAGGWFGTKTNHPLHFFVNDGSPSLTVSTSGNVGIGTATPSNKLTVITPLGAYGLVHTDGTVAVGTYISGGSGWLVTKSNHRLLLGTGGVADMAIETNGHVGIGTMTPSAQLSVQSLGGTLPLTVRQSALESATPGLASFETSNGAIGSIGANTNTFVISAAAGKDLGFNYGSTRGLTLNSFGDVVTAGHLYIGNLFQGAYGIHACVGDSSPRVFTTCGSAAEYVPTIDGGLGFPEAADLVSIAPQVANPYDDDHGPFVVAKSAHACDENLFGFIVKPEFGADGKKLNGHYLPLAIYGYFPAKVSTENGVIKRGDPLTSSSKPGYAMKATDACKIIGYALDDTSVEGTIQVFANTGEHSAPEVAALRQQVQQQKAQIADMEQQLTELRALVGDLQARMEK